MRRVGQSGPCVNRRGRDYQRFHVLILCVCRYLHTNDGHHSPDAFNGVAEQAGVLSRYWEFMLSQPQGQAGIADSASSATACATRGQTRASSLPLPDRHTPLPPTPPPTPPWRRPYSTRFGHPSSTSVSSVSPPHRAGLSRLRPPSTRSARDPRLLPGELHRDGSSSVRTRQWRKRSRGISLV